MLAGIIRRPVQAKRRRAAADALPGLQNGYLAWLTEHRLSCWRGLSVGPCKRSAAGQRLTPYPTNRTDTLPGLQNGYLAWPAEHHLSCWRELSVGPCKRSAAGQFRQRAPCQQTGRCCGFFVMPRAFCVLCKPHPSRKSPARPR